MRALEPKGLSWVERRHIHEIHRVSLGLLFVWFGLLKPFGLRTTTSLLANTVYVLQPELVVPVLGWWEVAIGVFLLNGKLVKFAVGLLLIRLPGTILALVLMRDVCFAHFPLAPTPEGQYLIKDLVVFFACLAVALPAADGGSHGPKDPVAS